MVRLLMRSRVDLISSRVQTLRTRQAVSPETLGRNGQMREVPLCLARQPLDPEDSGGISSIPVWPWDEKVAPSTRGWRNRL